MKLIHENLKLKCDCIMCKNLSNITVNLGTYHGNLHLCNSCFKKAQNLLKKEEKQYENKQ